MLTPWIIHRIDEGVLNKHLPSEHLGLFKKVPQGSQVEGLFFFFFLVVAVWGLFCFVSVCEFSPTLSELSD